MWISNSGHCASQSICNCVACTGSRNCHSGYASTAKGCYGQFSTRACAACYGQNIANIVARTSSSDRYSCYRTSSTTAADRSHREGSAGARSRQIVEYQYRVSCLYHIGMGDSVSTVTIGQSRSLPVIACYRVRYISSIGLCSDSLGGHGCGASKQFIVTGTDGLVTTNVNHLKYKLYRVSST